VADVSSDLGAMWDALIQLWKAMGLMGTHISSIVTDFLNSLITTLGWGAIKDNATRSIISLVIFVIVLGLIGRAGETILGIAKRVWILGIRLIIALVVISAITQLIGM
jgi:hypothetical protein